MSTEVKFERVDGKADAGTNKKLVVKNPAQGTLVAGDILTGIYKKTMISDLYGTPGYILEINEEDVLVSGSGALNKQMSKVNVGELIQIQYNGKFPMKDGKFAGTMSHSYTVRRAINSDEAAS